MELEEIVIENFGTIEHIKLVLNTPGMILITGINKDAPKADSNGAGKSLLLDAICWCLWGKTVRGLTADDVVRRQIGKDCCVSLQLKDAKFSYTVVRHRQDTRVDKPNDLRLFINGVEKGKKMKNLQEIIDNIVGFDFDTFCAMMPGAGVSAASLTDSKIKELLEKLLQTEQLSHAYAVSRDRLKVLELGLAQQNTTLLDLKGQLVSLEKEVDQLRDLEQSFVAKKAENIVASQQRISNLVRDIAVCDIEVQKIASLQSSIATFKTEVDLLKVQMNAIEQPAQTQIRLWKAEQAECEALHREYLHEVELLNKKSEALTQLGATCPTCEAAITPEHILACRVAIAEQLVEMTKDPRAVKSGSAQELRRLARELCDTTAKQLAELQGHVDMKTFAIADLQKSLVTANTQAAIKARLEKDLKREQENLVAAQAETHNFAEIFATKAAKVGELVQAVCQCLTTRRQLEKEHKLCSFWVDGFSPAGLRSYMLDYVTPILNDRAAYYSEVLTGGEMKVTFTTKTALKKGGEKDKFQILVEQQHGGNLYEATSKGEKARADLVIAMALGDLATFRTAKQLPWRFLDEPFENIDDAGNEAVVQLLNDQKSRYKTVFVVTHKPAFKKLFNQRIAVIKENGVSRLEHERVSE